MFRVCGNPPPQKSSRSHELGVVNVSCTPQLVSMTSTSDHESLLSRLSVPIRILWDQARKLGLVTGLEQPSRDRGLATERPVMRAQGYTYIYIGVRRYIIIYSGLYRGI